jgi:hypothetical protein
MFGKNYAAVGARHPSYSAGYLTSDRLPFRPMIVEPNGTSSIGSLHDKREIAMIRALLFSVTLAAAAILASPSFAQSNFDGAWTVTVVTSAGNCEPMAQYPLTVSDGKVSGSPDVSGNIGAAGLVRVSIRGAFANGKLNGSAGAGRWNAASAGFACSGSWQASKH